jgi:hypothetical protein
VTAKEYTEQSAELEELEEILGHLNNGGVLDQEWVLRGVRFFLRRLRYIMIRETVTEDDCTARRKAVIDEAKKCVDDHVASCIASRMVNNPKGTAKNIILPHLFSALGWLLLCAMLAKDAYF